MVNPQNQNPAELLRRFKDSWLDKANPDHPGEYEESEKTVDSLMQIIIKYCSETNTIFLLEPTLNILLKNQSQFDNQDLESINNFENIENRVIEFLRDDESFNVEVDNHFKELDSPESLYKTHPILSHFLLPKPGDETDQPPPPVPIKIIVLVVLVVLALGSVGLWIYFHRLDPIFSLCKRDFWGSGVKIDCGDEQLSNVSKWPNQEMETLINKLDTDFAKKRDPSTLIALNNAKVLQALKSTSLNINDVYPIGVAIPKSAKATGANEAGKHILSGVAKKQAEYNSLAGKKLFVVVADDQNDDPVAMEIAKQFDGKKSLILGVIGPYSSSNLAYVLPIYTKNQVPLISPTVTAAMTDIKAEIGFSKQNTSFFFRMPEDTDASTRSSLNYLKNKGYKQLIVFADDKDLYSLSLLKRLREQNNTYKFSIVKHDNNSDFIPTRNNNNLPEVTRSLIAKYGNQRTTTAILYFQGAYKDKLDEDSLKRKLIQVLEENQGEFLVLGSNPARQDGLFDSLNNNATILNQLVVIQPWFSSGNSTQFRKYQDFWKSKDIVNWRYIMAYDATQVLLYAINNRENKNQYPTRQQIQQILTSDLVQNKGCADKTKLGITDYILTTKITFNGSDRCPNPDGIDGYLLIKPVEIKPGEWDWKSVDENAKQ
jgi:ABC-type branched-subunit amino acid transport system substrate-binding protein